MQVRHGLAWVLIVAALAACSTRRPRGSSRQDEDEAQKAPASAGTSTGAGTAESRPRTRFVRSSRCGECHQALHNDWQNAAHSRANRSAAYRRAVDSLDATGQALCQSCHLPGLALGQPEDALTRPPDGVGCDVCHTIRDVQVGPTTAAVTFDRSSGRRYGPIMQPADNYFHGMGKSELHARSEICASCHHALSFTLGAETRNIPVVTDYAGWKTHGRDKACQDCHMPSRGTEPVARGGKPRPNVPGHGFPGAPLLGKSLRLEVSVDRKGGLLTVEVGHNAGHLLPSGFVDRRLLVRVTFFTRAGVEVGREERGYGIYFVDPEGRPAPFFRAARIKEDRRMTPGEMHLLSFDIPQPVERQQAPVRATVSLLAAATAPELAETYGLPTFSVLRTAQASLSSGASSAAGSAAPATAPAAPPAGPAAAPPAGAPAAAQQTAEPAPAAPAAPASAPPAAASPAAAAARAPSPDPEGEARR